MHLQTWQTRLTVPLPELGLQPPLLDLGGALLVDVGEPQLGLQLPQLWVRLADQLAPLLLSHVAPDNAAGVHLGSPDLTAIHRDPKNTAAWNTVCSGIKRWVRALLINIPWKALLSKYGYCTIKYRYRHRDTPPRYFCFVDILY